MYDSAELTDLTSSVGGNKGRRPTRVFHRIRKDFLPLLYPQVWCSFDGASKKYLHFLNFPYNYLRWDTSSSFYCNNDY